VYEITDHLGNVRATVSSVKINGIPEVLSYTDFYPHGGILPGRNYVSSNAYRYDYQGQEKDPETNWSNFELRMYDANLARWMSPDPYGEFHSPYLAMGNNPVSTIDPDGGKTVADPTNIDYDNGRERRVDPFDMVGGGSHSSRNVSFDFTVVRNEFGDYDVLHGTKVSNKDKINDFYESTNSSWRAENITENGYSIRVGNGESIANSQTYTTTNGLTNVNNTKSIEGSTLIYVNTSAQGIGGLRPIDLIPLVGSANSYLENMNRGNYLDAIADLSMYTFELFTLGAASEYVIANRVIKVTAKRGANLVDDIAVQFGKGQNQLHHVFRHTDALGLDRSLVQSTVQKHFKTVSSQVVAGKPFNQIIQIGGQRVQYTAFKLSDGTYNIGRIHGIQ
jgi:RHS repeat-associated protein